MVSITKYAALSVVTGLSSGFGQDPEPDARARAAPRKHVSPRARREQMIYSPSSRRKNV
jgi:hypothetical protein